MRPSARARTGALASLSIPIVLIAVTAAAAQLPPATAYVMVSRQTPAPALAAVDAAGKVTSLVPLAGATAPVAIAMSARNNELIAWDDGKLHHYDVQSGTCTRSTLAAFNRVSTAVVDEDGGMIWGTHTGLILKSSDSGCTALATILVLGSHDFRAIAVEGSTGRWLVSGWDSLARDHQLLYLDINGWVTQTIHGMPAVTGLAWSPWSDCIYGTYDDQGGGVIRVDRAGVVTTLSLPPSAARTNLTGLDLLHQPVERLLCVEGGASPQHLVQIAPDGSLTTVHSSSRLVDPSGCTPFRGRALWATSGWSLGKVSFLSLDFGPSQARRHYQIALSFRSRPGIAVPGVGTIHLEPDGLFHLSLAAGPPLFEGFRGTLDAQGRQPLQPFARVPAEMGLLGLRIYGGAIAYDHTGVTAISNAWSITVGWT